MPLVIQPPEPTWQKPWSKSVVMISLEDYEALQETAYLLRAPKNARRLMESVAELEQGHGQEKELLE
jgi:antitoxin YefM